MTEQELKYQIESAATSMLSDEDICVSLGITPETLEQYYSIVESARVRLRQRLNAKRITDAAAGDGSIDKLVNNIPVSVNNKDKQSRRGEHMKGKTNNPNGRPKGTTNKLSGQAILEAIAEYDVPFEQGLAEDYRRARMSEDRHLIVKYQQLILNKVVADKTNIDLTSGGEILKAAFSFVPVELVEWSKSGKSNDTD